MRTLRTTRKLALSALLLVGAAGVAGLGTYATFTDDAAPGSGQTITAGTVVISIGTDGSADNRLTVGASGVVPGDTIQRQVHLTNDGNQDLSGITLTTAGTGSNLLTTDTTDGLQLKVEKCSLATGWVESVTTPYTYTCPLGTVTTVLANTSVVGTARALGGLDSLTAGADDHLRVTLSLPSTADNDFQNLSSTITYSFEATQRAATNK